MSVGKQGSSQVTVTLDDGAGVPRAITNFTMTLGGTKIVVATQESTAFGDAWIEHLASGMRSVPDIPIGGLFDTTATTGPHAVMAPVANDADPNGTTRTLVVVYGDGKTFTVEGIMAEYEVAGQVGKLTEFNAVLRPTGAGVWT